MQSLLLYNRAVMKEPKSLSCEGLTHKHKMSREGDLCALGDSVPAAALSGPSSLVDTHSGNCAGSLQHIDVGNTPKQTRSVGNVP